VLALISIVLRHPVLFLISLILVLLAATSHLWAKYSLAGVTYRRAFDQHRLFFGEETEMRIELVNAKPLPLSWLRVDDAYPTALKPDFQPRRNQPASGRQRLVHVFSLRWYERVTRRYRLRGGQRGLWRFGPAQLRSGDIFGFDIRRKTLENAAEIVVYPLVVPVAALGLPARHPFGEFRSTLRIIADPLLLAGAREYSRGDNFRHIHWKATARRRTLQTKVFEPSASRPVAIFLNVTTFEHFSQGQDWALQEYAITAAASLARQLWDEGHALGLYVNALLTQEALFADGNGESPGSERIRIAPRQQPSQLMRVLEALARIDDRGRWTIEALLQVESGRLLFGTTIVVISAVVTRRLRLALIDLQRKGYGVALVALGDAQLEPPIPGVVYYHIGGRERWFELMEGERLIIDDQRPTTSSQQPAANSQ